MLRPIAEFVNAVEGEKYLTIAFAPILFGKCLQQLEAARNDDRDLEELKRRLRVALNERLGRLLTGINLGLAAAAVCPALGHLKFIDDELRDEVSVFVFLSLFLSQLLMRASFKRL